MYLPIEALAEFEYAMMDGNFRKASEVAGKIPWNDFKQWYASLDNTTLFLPGNVRAVTVMAEWQFYIGAPHNAQFLLDKYANQKPRFLDLPLGPASDEVSTHRERVERFTDNATEIAPKDKLQLAQYFFSKRDFVLAKDVTETVRKQCEGKSEEESNQQQRPLDLFGLGLCHHQFARFASRRDEFVEAEQHCDEAIGYLAQAGTLSTDDWYQRRIAWRMGLVLLTKGHASWLAGRLRKSKSHLYPAHFFLNKTFDFINRANVEQSLGRLLYSEGDQTNAQKFFTAAENKYPEDVHHPLHLSRWALNMGNVYCAQWEGRDFSRAKAFYMQALTFAEEPPSNERQQALVLLAQSALYQEEHPDHDLDQALRTALKARAILSKLENTRRSSLRMEFVLGTCRMKRKEYELASKALGRALKLASELHVPYWQAQAHLYFAELALYQDNLPEALNQYREGCDFLERLNGAENIPQDIKNKCEEIERALSASQKKIFVLYPESITDQEGESGRLTLEEIEYMVRKWAISRALENADNNKTKAAKMLGISRVGFEKALKKSEKVTGLLATNQ